MRELFSYDKKTGLLTRRVKVSQRTKIGDVVGTEHGDGYLRVMVNGKHYYIHRIIYAMVTGEQPDFVDHKDHNRSNNKWNNLRNVTHKNNLKNTEMYSSNTSGYKGVTWRKRRCKWQSRIMVDGKSIHLGYFDSSFEAWIARLDAEDTYGFHINSIGNNAA